MAMKRSHILARELRGTLLVLFVGAMIFWLFARLNDDRAEAQIVRAAAQSTTSVVETTTTTMAVVVDDNERLCSLSQKFRGDLSNIRVQLVNLAGDPIAQNGDLPIDVGMHADGDIPEEVREERTVAGEEAFANGAAFTTTTVPVETTTTTTPPPLATPPPEVIDTDRIDPLESGLLGEPQTVALNFYTAASALRLGTITADFASAADYFADFVGIGEPERWDLEVLETSDFSDQWKALATQPVFGIDATLAYIEEECSVRIGRGFVYREEAPEIETFTPRQVTPAVDPNAIN